jgi:uncharacterized phage protein (TIGR01671 family)
MRLWRIKIMRKILFRGKTEEDKWVYGDLISNIWGNIRTGNPDTSIIPNDSDITDGYEIQEYIVDVIPKTVGQFTGLKDKNGAKIFDGDIIQYGKNLYIVEYHVEIGATVCVRTNDVDHWPSFNVGTIKHTMVVGNIHDNPELLEVPDDK